MSYHRRGARVSLAVASLALLSLSSCVDGPAAPADLHGPMGPGVVVAPAFSLVGPGGASVRSQAQADALEEAFDRVNRFRFVVRRASTNAVVIDTVVTVSPGQTEYDFAFNVSAAPSESFRVRLTAFEGDTELFQADDITVQAAPPAAAGGGVAAPTNIALQYSGPGTSATSVQITPSQLVLPPGGTGTLTADVQDASGVSISGVPLSYSTSVGGVATVDGGAVTGTADGLTEVVVATPTGLEARAWIYVVDASLAYVEGGALMVRGAASGEPQQRAADASAPAWSPDGSRLYYVSGGFVRLAGSDGDLVGGGWPSVSPDGDKLAVEQDGTVVFANVDGTNATAGPAGGMPVWDSGEDVLVAGGSIERVRANGEGRTTVVGGSATAPARSPSGAVAYLDGGNLRVVGVDSPLSAEVEGRPSFSGNGRWLVARTGSGLTLFPASGAAPGAPLPGLEGASHPAFQPSGALSAPASLSLTGLVPDPPVPGQPVEILGSGFDWIIPANNLVTWPTFGGIEETLGSEASPTGVVTTMPRAVSAGQIRVSTRSSTAVLEFVPTLGAIEVHAATSDGTPVPDVTGIVSTEDGTEVGRGTTDATGTLLLPGLVPGTYVLQVSASEGFEVIGDKRFTLAISTAATVVDLVIRPRVHRIEVSPSDPTLGVGERVEVSVRAFDRNGNAITRFDDSFWGGGTGHLAAGGSGLAGVIIGVYPSTTVGDASYNVRLNDQLFSPPATVTSHISGTVTVPAPASAEGMGLADTRPALGVEVRLSGGGVDLSTATDDRGSYRFPGLLAGTYTVEVIPPEELSIGTPTRTITLGAGNPTGTADFALTDVSDGGLATDFRVLVLGNGYPNSYVVAEFASRWPDIEFVDFDGYSSTPSLEFLTGFQVILLYEDGVYTNAVNVGNAVADYVDQGGNVVFGTFYWQDRSDGGWHIAGWGRLEDVDPFVGKVESDGRAGSEYNADSLDPASIVPHVLTDGVTSLSVDSYHGGVIEKSDAVVLARWSDEVPLIGYRIESGGQRLLGVSVAPGYVRYGGFSGDFYRLWENALRWAGAGSTPVPPPPSVSSSDARATLGATDDDGVHHTGSGSAACSAGGDSALGVGCRR